MVFIPVPASVAVSMTYLQGGQRIQNVFGVKYATNPDVIQLGTLGTDILAWYEAHLKPLQVPEATLTLVTITGLWAQDALALENATGLPSAGGNVGAEPAPNNVTLALRWSTNTRGRSYRGRTFHIGIPKAAVTGNQVNSDHLEDVIAAYTALITAINVTGRELAVISRYANSAPRDPGIATGIVSVSSEGTVDSQRRRLPGRGM